MRYFIYKDSSIHGPYAPEDIGGLEPGTLVCEESLSGRRDTDWKNLEEVAELSGARLAPAVSLDVDAPLSGVESGLFERLELEALGIPRPDDDEAKDWAYGLVDKLPEVKGSDELRLAETSLLVREMSEQIKALVARLEEREARQPLLGPSTPPPPQYAPAPKATPNPSKGIKFTGTRSFRVVKKPASAPSMETEQEETPTVGGNFDAGPGPGGAPQVYDWETTAPAAASGPPALPEARAIPPLGQGSAAPPAAAAGLPPAPPPKPAGEGGPITPLALPPEESEPAPSGAALPIAPIAAGLPPAPAPALPAVLAPATPAPTPEPLIRLEAPSPAPGGPVTPALLQTGVLPPAVGVGPQPSAAPPMTMAYSGPGGLPSSFSALTPSRANAQAPAPAPGPATQDMVSRMAKPAGPGAKTASPKKRSSALFLIGGLLLVLVLGGAGFFFLRSSKDLKLMLNMGGEQKRLGAEAQEEAAFPVDGGTLPQEAASPPQPSAGSLTSQDSAAPAPGVAPAGGGASSRDALPDPGEAAIALVKNYPLDGDRGAVGQWLQYSFAANPGDGAKEEWTAGAVDAAAYLVQYRVLPGGTGGVKEPITYLFEADTSRRTVKGSNPAARQLMGGASQPKTQAAPAKPRPRPARRRGRSAAPAPAAKAVPVLPLPPDSDLLPPAEDDSEFRRDTVR